jgi:GTP cyclohydrolase FolE2
VQNKKKMSTKKSFCLQNSIDSLIERFRASTSAKGDGLLRRVGQAAVILAKHSTLHFIHYYTLKVIISW